MIFSVQENIIMKNLLVIENINAGNEKLIFDLKENYSVKFLNTGQLKTSLLEFIYPDLILIFSCKIKTAHHNLIRLLKRNYPDVPVLLFGKTGFTSEVINSLKIGAVGYYNLNDTKINFEEIILSSVNGKMFLPKLLAEDIISPDQTPKKINKTFTARELLFLTLLKDSVSYALIADKLGITVDKINFLIRNIYRKLHFYYNVSEVI